MPACFELISKKTQEPEVLSVVDDAMRKHFKAEPDPKYWYMNWYTVIGFAFACGRDIEFLTKLYIEEDLPEYVAILTFIDENYTVNAFRGI